MTSQQELEQYIKDCEEFYKHWAQERKDGCVDPNWFDGDNLNLARNHIICTKKNIRRTCDNFGLVIPAIYYRPLPPEMSADFFVIDGKNYNQKRIARIMNLRGKPDDDREEKPVQLTLF